jgi:tape measure domain-containing protein
MSTIDQRIVSMVFENAKFEQGIKQSMDSLKKFNDVLNKTGNTKGFSDIDKAASKVNLSTPMSAIGKVQGALSRMGNWAGQGFGAIDKAGSKLGLTGPLTAIGKVQSAVSQISTGAPEAFGGIERAADKVDFSGLSNALDNVGSKFNVMSGAAAVAIGNLATKVIDVGTLGSKHLTIDPVSEGFKNYETQIDAVQTILANTGLKGKAGLGEVTRTLKELNTYANKTVYNFSDMARNIGIFTAAGVKLAPATASIKGIANLGAMSGSNPEQVSHAMMQLSQAIASGKVGLQDWISVVNAQMGGQVFQKALANTAENLHTLSGRKVEFDKATNQLKIGGETFRDSMKGGLGAPPPWITSNVLVKTLEHFTGDMSKAQLAAQGFSKEQIKQIQDQAKLAVQSATQIKTVTQLFQALREEVGTAWANVWKVLFGDINQAKAILSPLHTYIENGLTNPIYNFTKVLQRWADMGGRIKFIDALKQGYKDIQSIIKPIEAAFRDVFPAKTAGDLMSMTNGFANLMKRLQATPEVMQDLRDTFGGFFAVLHIGWTIVKEVAKVIGDLLGIAGHGAGGFLHITGNIGKFLKVLDDTISKGHALNGFFSGLGAVMKLPLALLSSFANTIYKFFNSGDLNNANKAMDGMGSAWDRLKQKGGPVVGFLIKIGNIIGSIQNRLAPVTKAITVEISRIFEAIQNSLKNANWDGISSAMTAGMFGGIFLLLKKELGGGLKIQIGAFGNAFKGLTNVFHAMTNQLKIMQKEVISTMILKIAIAIGLLAASALVMSKIDADKLAKALGAMAVGMGEIVGAMALMDKSMGKVGGFKMSGMATSLMILSAAMLILAHTMKVFASMSWQGIAKGLVGVGGGLAALSGGLSLINKTGVGGKGMIATGIGLMFVATSMTILAAATKVFASMSWGSLVKGLVGMTGALAAVNIGVIGLGPELLVVGPGLLVTAMAVAMLSGAVASFGRIPLKNLALGILGMGAAIAMLAYEIEMIPPWVAAQGVGLILLSVGLEGIAAVIASLGKMNISTLAKGIVAIGLALAVLGAGLFALEVGGGGVSALALLGIATALAILVPTIGLMGTMKWSTIAKGLAGIAAAIAVLAIAGLVASEPIAALGVALLPLGLFLGEIAVSVLIFAKAMQLLGGEGARGLAVFMGAIAAYITMIPHLIVAFIEGILHTIIDSANMLIKMAPELIKALDKMFTIVDDFWVREGPKIGKVISNTLDFMLKVLKDNAPKLFQAGLNLIDTLQKGLLKNDHISKIVNRASLIIIKFLDALGNHSRDIANAGARVLIKFLEGIGKNAFKIAKTAVGIVAKFQAGLYTYIPQLAIAGARMVVSMIKGMGRGAVRIANVATKAIISFLSALEKDVPKVVRKGLHVARVLIESIAKGLVRLADIGAQGIIDFLNGIAEVIRHRGKQIRKAGWNVASALIDGLLDGFKDLWHKVRDALLDLGKKIPWPIRQALKILSPSKVFHEIGTYISMGLANGIEESGIHAENASENLGHRVHDSMRKTLASLPKHMEFQKMNPTIRPVLDLSEIKKGSKEIGKHLGTSHLAVGFSASQAGAIAHEKAQIDLAHTKSVTAESKPSVSFVQNNHSPEKLSTAEIYRRTNNQLSKIRKHVGIE